MWALFSLDSSAQAFSSSIYPICTIRTGETQNTWSRISEFFFETLNGYAVVNLEDVRDVYVKTGLRDRIFGTGRLFVGYRDFQPTTKFWIPGGAAIFLHKPPSFRFIREMYEVQKLIQEAADHAQRRNGAPVT